MPDCAPRSLRSSIALTLEKNYPCFTNFNDAEFIQ
jgi:hypothetical protein